LSQFKKLVVDNKTMYVFDVIKIPHEILRLTNLIGIELKDTSFKEREPYLDFEIKQELIKTNIKNRAKR